MTINSVDSFLSSRFWGVHYSLYNTSSSAYAMSSTLGDSRPALAGSSMASWGFFGFTGSIPTGGFNISGCSSGTYAVPNAAANKNNYFLGASAYVRNNYCRTSVADLLWFCTGARNNTGTIGIYSTRFPARDASGTDNGYGVQLAAGYWNPAGPSTLAMSSFSGMSVEYTNSDGVSNRTGYTLRQVNTAGSIGQSTFLQIHLQDNDVGVQSVQQWFYKPNAGGATDVNFRLVAYRPIAELFSYNSDSATAAYCGITDNGMPILYSGTSLFFILNNINNSTNTRDIYLRFAEG